MPETRVHPWQMLDSGIHLDTLRADYAPVGLLEMIKVPPRKVLDVGCFCGGSGRWLKGRFPDCTVIGIEMLEKAAATAAKAYDRVIVRAFEEVDFDAEGLPPGSVDTIIAADVLEHLYNPWKALQRLKALLAPGGAIFISLPNVRNLNVLAGLANGEWHYAGAGILDITHVRFFTRAQALQMLEQTGWMVEDLRINPDQSLKAAFEGKNLAQIQSINVGLLRLDRMKEKDVLELLTLQYFIKAVPASL
jgi:2-polyprenyl-3-methyl-5-hydroxy-6-metoxy-1,4-benzoquinol methylase